MEVKRLGSAAVESAKGVATVVGMLLAAVVFWLVISGFGVLISIVRALWDTLFGY